MDSEFYKIGTSVQTDKVYHHGYHRFYPNVIKKDIKQMLEIGFDEGKSTNLWLNYLPECYIWGLDIAIETKGERFNILKGDQSNIGDLNNTIDIIGKNKLDFIIDDGSHIPEHQILTFSYFFEKLLKNGGTYIIEDIETSYWSKNGLYAYVTNYGLNNEYNIINVFSKVLHVINSEFLTEENKLQIQKDSKINDTIINSISTITFGQNCIIIKKKEDYEYEYNNRTYRFSYNL